MAGEPTNPSDEPHRPWDDLINLIFDVGALNLSDINRLRLVQLAARLRVLRRGQAKERLRHYVWRRASAALEALETGRARYLQDGFA
jgi:8-oxo-dGTP diphosphatase